MADEVEQTLHICREVHVYRIPPRSGADGYRSGEWKVADKIFSGRLRVVARGELCEVKIEDPSSSELFAICPVPFGKTAIAVEPVTDSSRYFVLRVEDPSTKRHAFLGMGFTDRGDAFDFKVALDDHQKHVERARAAASITASGGVSSSAAPVAAAVQQEVASLYKAHGDLSLKEGQTIRINVSKPGGAKPGGLLSSASSSAAGHAAPVLRPLAPPPAAGAFSHSPVQQQQDWFSGMGSSSGQQQQQGFFGAGTQPAYEQAPVASNSGNLLDGDFFSSAPARPVGGGGGGGVPDLLGLGDFVSSPPAVAAAAHPKPAAAPKPADNWAVFD